MALARCPKCGREVSPESACPHCGQGTPPGAEPRTSRRWITLLQDSVVLSPNARAVGVIMSLTLIIGINVYIFSPRGAMSPPPEPVPTPPSVTQPEPAPPSEIRPEAKARERAAAEPVPFKPREDLRTVPFTVDTSAISSAAAQTLDHNVKWLKANPGYLVRIEGHADDQGSTEDNIDLGERRAKAVAEYLVANGIDANRLAIVSYGAERPVCTERTEACRATNRRIEWRTKPR